MGLLQGVKGLFKPKIVKKIYGGVWGHLTGEHGVSVDTLSQDIRCVDKPAVKNGSNIILIRIFSLRDVEKKGINITGWETFDQHPDLVMFEGYLDDDNKAYLESRHASGSLKA